MGLDDFLRNKSAPLPPALALAAALDAPAWAARLAVDPDGALAALPAVAAQARVGRPAIVGGAAAAVDVAVKGLADAGAAPDARVTLALALVERWARGERVGVAERAAARLGAAEAWRGFRQEAEAAQGDPPRELRASRQWDTAAMGLGLVRAAWDAGDGLAPTADALRAAAFALAGLRFGADAAARAAGRVQAAFRGAVERLCQ